MFTVLSARAPRWADLAHTSITLMVLFEETKDTYGEVPFSASPDDSEPHGVELYDRAVAGDFGEVLEPTLEMIQTQVMCQRGALSASATARVNELAASLDTLEDAVRLKLATDDQAAALPAVSAELDAWRLYRVQLAQLDILAGYPMSFDWPQSPVQPFLYVPSEGDELKLVKTVAPSEFPN